jgi:hypothetical protein
MSVTVKYLQSWIDICEFELEVATYFAATKVPATGQVDVDEFFKSSTDLRNVVSPNDI